MFIYCCCCYESKINYPLAYDDKQSSDSYWHQLALPNLCIKWPRATFRWNFAAAVCFSRPNKVVWSVSRNAPERAIWTTNLFRRLMCLYSSDVNHNSLVLSVQRSMEWTTALLSSNETERRRESIEDAMVSIWEDIIIVIIISSGLMKSFVRCCLKIPKMNCGERGKILVNIEIADCAKAKFGARMTWLTFLRFVQVRGSVKNWKEHMRRATEQLKEGRRPLCVGSSVEWLLNLLFDKVAGHDFVWNWIPTLDGVLPPFPFPTFKIWFRGTLRATLSIRSSCYVVQNAILNRKDHNFKDVAQIFAGE